MTVEEAIDQCLGAGISTETNEPIGWLDTDKLRSLGYVIIPVTPSGETVERAAVALFDVAPFRDAEGPFESQSATYRELTRIYVRAAYAAIVGVEK